MAKLWDKEITVDEQISLLEDFSSYLEASMLVTIEKFKSIIILQKMGWLNDARDFLVKTLPEVCDEVGGYLVRSKLINPPNWKIFLKDRLEIAKEAGQAIYSYHEKCFQICASQYQQQYQATYEQELAKQDGLSFGIISSSLAAHLVYAAQSASKERQNEKKASEAADKIMHSSLSPVEKAGQMTIAFYHEKYDPFVVEFLVGFYSDIERLIYDGLEIDKEVLDNNKALSNNELIIIGIVLLVFLSNKIEYNNQVKQYCTFETAITKTSSEYDCIYALECLAYEYHELGDDIRADWRSYKDDEAKTQEKLLLELEKKFDESALKIIDQSSANLKYSSNELIKTLKEDGYLIYCIGERHSKGDYEYAFDSYLFFFSKTYTYDCTYYIIETLYPETFTKGIKERLVGIGESRGSYEHEQ